MILTLTAGRSKTRKANRSNNALQTDAASSDEVFSRLQMVLNRGQYALTSLILSVTMKFDHCKVRPRLEELLAWVKIWHNTLAQLIILFLMI